MNVSQKIIPLLILILGILILIQVSTPIVLYKFWETIHFENTNFVEPFPAAGSSILGISIQTKDNFPAFISEAKRTTPSPYAQFSLTIKKLGIKQAKVNVDSNDLDKGPALLPGTALPGEKGNVFISSHSSVLFNNNFSRLNNLQTGDEILVNAGGIDFNYRVIDTKVVSPNDLSVVAAPDGVGRFLSLMTCVPPGLNIKRLVVLAKLI